MLTKRPSMRSAASATAAQLLRTTRLGGPREPRTPRAALYAIGAIAILASANALTHSYAGSYDWAVHHSLTGWQAKS
jgi:hypothetical protein